MRYLAWIIIGLVIIGSGWFFLEEQSAQKASNSRALEAFNQGGYDSDPGAGGMQAILPPTDSFNAQMLALINGERVGKTNLIEESKILDERARIIANNLCAPQMSETQQDQTVLSDISEHSAGIAIQDHNTVQDANRIFAGADKGPILSQEFQFVGINIATCPTGSFYSHVTIELFTGEPLTKQL